MRNRLAAITNGHWAEMDGDGRIASLIGSGKYTVTEKLENKIHRADLEFLRIEDVIPPFDFSFSLSYSLCLFHWY